MPIYCFKYSTSGIESLKKNIPIQFLIISIKKIWIIHYKPVVMNVNSESRELALDFQIK